MWFYDMVAFSYGKSVLWNVRSYRTVENHYWQLNSTKSACVIDLQSKELGIENLFHFISLKK